VSWKERVRNAAIYEYQHNRNPFVDHPEYASAIYDSSNYVAAAPIGVALRVMLHAATPSPFQTRTSFAYELAQRGPVTLSLYDVGGRRVRTLLDGTVQDAGHHRFEWDGRDDTGTATAAGLYFARLVGSGASDVRRVVRVH
jgi:flagellar hook assembly protein FlgD